MPQRRGPSARLARHPQISAPSADGGGAARRGSTPRYAAGANRRWRRCLPRGACGCTLPDEMVAALALALVTALAGADLYRRWALHRVLDMPNERSSHTRPVPRGGGLVIVAGFAVGLTTWVLTGGALSPRAWGWLGGALLVAGVSFIDDLRPLPAAPRLAVHALGALGLTIVGVQERETPLVLAVPLAFVWVALVT